MSATARRRRWDGPDFRLGQCSTCRHYRFDATCDAFPRGIPPEILGEYGSHQNPRPGDNGIWWEPAPPDTTDGPIRYAMAHQLLDGRSVIAGAIWVGLEDGSIGWYPSPEYEGTPTSMAWLGSLRAAWRLGRTAAEFWDWWTTYSNGRTWAVGAVEEAESLADLRARLGYEQ